VAFGIRPQIHYLPDQNNAVGFDYSATEIWIDVRKGL